MIKEAIRRTEAAFENSGYWIHDHPKRVILMMLLVVGFLAFQLPSMKSTFYMASKQRTI